MLAVAVPIVGAPGTTAVMGNDWLARGAARKELFSAESALIVQVPTVTNVKTPSEVILQTVVVEDVNVGVDPDDAVAVSVGAVPKF